MKWNDRGDLVIPYYSFDNIDSSGMFLSAFTTRKWNEAALKGFDFQPLMRFDSEPDEVYSCVSAMLRQFGTCKEKLVRSAQQHTDNIYLVTEKDVGPEDRRPVIKNTDGLITNLEGVMLETFGADCPSVYLADSVNKAIGLCHSGRKGTQRHIAVKMLEAMHENFGSCPDQIQAAISPGICMDCYEVGDEVALDFISDHLRAAPPDEKKREGRDDIIRIKDGRYHIDLNAAIKADLIKAGVSEDKTEVSDLCTKCRSDIFYSFRAEGRISNENSALLMIMPERSV